MTTITLHYYRDNFRGLPRLRFFAVADDFNIWNATATDTACVDVAAVSPGGKRGPRNVSINVTFETKKVLMYKYSRNFRLQVSEVQFFNCSCKLLNIYLVPNELTLMMHTAAQTTIVSINSCSTSPSKYYTA